MNYLTTEDGKPIREANPLPVKAMQSSIEAANGEDAAGGSALVAGKSPAGKQVPLSVDEEGNLQVGGINIDNVTVTNVVAQLSGSDMEIYGTSISDRPAADTVPIGATFTIVDATQEFNSWISDGTTWGDEM